MGLLADIYSGSDSLKRKVKGLLADPLGTIEQKINQFGEDQQAAINNAQDATGFGGNRSVLMGQQQKQQASKALGDYAGSMGLAGMFVGQGSSTWNKAEADKALKMAQSGTDPRKIWSETGNWKGPDGAWRQEIDDSGASLLKQSSTITDYMSDIGPSTYPSKMDALLSHRNLGGAYPDVAAMPLTMKNGVGGEFFVDGHGPHISVGAKHRGGTFHNPEQTKSTAMHEVQHAIQQKEGWAQGGSPDGLAPALSREAKEFRKQARNLDDSAWRNDPLGPSELLKPGARKKALAMEKQASDLESWASRINEFGDGYANTAYKNLAGEAEARATQARIPLDASARRALFPEDSYDVPMNQLIIRGLLAK